MLPEQRAYATHESGAERKTVDTLVLVREESDEKKEMCVGKVLLPFCCVVRGGLREQ